MIGKGKRILVDYIGKLDDGTVFDSSEISGPLDIVTDRNMVITGLDEALITMEVGESRTIVVPPEKAFGEYTENNIQKRALRYIPNAEELPVGQRISFMGPGGQKVSALVKEIDDEYAYLDFNNKLAGKTLTYEITVLEELPAKTRRTPISDYGPMARTNDTHGVAEVPVFNNFLDNLGITPADIERRYQEIQEEKKALETSGTSNDE